MEVSYLISKAEAAYQHCRRLCEDGCLYREEAAYVGSRLALVLATVHQWRRLISSSSSMDEDDSVEEDDGGVQTTSAVFDHFHDVLEEVYLCMEAAATTSTSAHKNDDDDNVDVERGCVNIREDRKMWREKVKNFLEGSHLLEAIQRAKAKLDAALVDFNINQSNVILEEVQGLKGSIREVQGLKGSIRKLVRDSLTDALEQFSQQKVITSDKSSSNVTPQTLQEKVNEVLEEYNRNPIELQIDRRADITESAESSHSASSNEGGSNQPRQQHSKTVTFQPLPHEVKALELEEEVVCSYKVKHLLGGGNFSEVFSGRYKGMRVAIKRLKVDKKEFKCLKLTKEQLHQDERRVMAEAALMVRCGHSNIVEVIGCRAVYTKIERPIIVMQVSAR